MSRRFWGVAAPVLGLVLSAWTCRAQENPPATNPPPAKQGVGEKVGGAVEGVVESIKRGARDTSEAVREKYAQARTSVHNMGIQSRVYSRLHWDKMLNGVEFGLDVKDDGVATLTGTVADARAKAKALELTQDTMGVTQVVDHLTIGAVTTPTNEVTKTRTTTTTETTTKP